MIALIWRSFIKPLSQWLEPIRLDNWTSQEEGLLEHGHPSLYSLEIHPCFPSHGTGTANVRNHVIIWLAFKGKHESPRIRIATSLLKALCTLSYWREKDFCLFPVLWRLTRMIIPTSVSVLKEISRIEH